MDMNSRDELSADELQEMEDRSNAAAPGPWSSLVVGRDLEAGLNCIVQSCCKVIEIYGGTVADQDFIAHAREDLPRLIDELRILRANASLASTMVAASRTKVSSLSNSYEPAEAV